MNIIVVGFGAMGQGITKLLHEKKTCELVGVVDNHPRFSDKNVNHFIKEIDETISIHGSLAELKNIKIDVAIITTGSTIDSVFPIIMDAIGMNMNVITIAEEMAYPKIKNQELSEQINEKANEHGVTVLGTGINPGFILDILIVVLSSVCFKVDKVKAVRVNDLSVFGSTVLDSQGIGSTVQEFYAGVDAGEIVGHVGFPQSVSLIAEAFGWEIDEIIEEKHPIISTVECQLAHRMIEAGSVVGCNHRVIAKSKGEIVIELQHPQQVLPGLEGIKTKDEICITGTPDIRFVIEPEIPGGIGTVAMAVNMIPLVIKARKGLITMLELPGLPSIFQQATKDIPKI